jgi:hypothetical protein
MGWSRKLRALSTAALIGGIAILSALATAPAGTQSAEAQVAAGPQAWVQRALALQYLLGHDVGLRNAPWVGTHNTYNSTAEMGQTLSAQDSNQELKITDQLDLGIRSIELDVHWFFSAQTGGLAPVVCHARPGSQAHAGCTIEKLLATVLDEVVGWLRAPGNRKEVLQVHLEDHLDNATGYDTAAAVLQQKLGSLLYSPPTTGSGCAKLPLDLTRKQILSSGARVFLVSDCGPGMGWPSVVFDWGSHEEARPRNYKDFPDCGPDFSRADYNNKLIRYFEDSTQLSAGTGMGDDGIKPKTAAAMARCGVDLIDLDQLTVTDPRQAALVWSWRQGQPAAGRCAVQRRLRKKLETPWRTRRCRKLRRPACRKGARWVVPKRRARQRKGRAVCRKRRARFAVPRSGHEAQLLRLAMERRGAKEVWLGYVRKGGRWLALDKRG